MYRTHLHTSTLIVGLQFPFEGKVIPVTCLPGEIGATELSNAPPDLRVEPGPCTFKHLKQGLEEARKVARQ